MSFQIGTPTPGGGNGRTATDLYLREFRLGQENSSVVPVDVQAMADRRAAEAQWPAWQVFFQPGQRIRSPAWMVRRVAVSPLDSP